MTYAERTHCPGCNALAASSSLHMSAATPAEKVAPDQLTSFASGYGAARNFFTYYKCDNCQLYYCRQFFLPDDLNRLYASQPENTGEASLAARERTQHGYYELWKNYPPVPGAYLELGPDIGLLTRELARNDAYSEVILLEPNVNVRDALEKNSNGLPSPRISELDLKDEKLPDASLSAVVMVHVFDHLYDLSGYLQELHRVTKPGGRMFIVTHNADCLLARVLKARFPPYALQHPQLFTPASITEVLARHGFEVVKVEKTTNYFPIAYLVRAVMDIFGLPSRWIPNLENPMLGIGLGNIATVAVRK